MSGVVNESYQASALFATISINTGFAHRQLFRVKDKTKRYEGATNNEGRER